MKHKGYDECSEYEYYDIISYKHCSHCEYFFDNEIAQRFECLRETEENKDCYKNKFET